jgi:hypothetical protein
MKRNSRWVFAAALVMACCSLTASGQTVEIVDSSVGLVSFSGDCGCASAPLCGCEVAPDCGCDTGGIPVCNRCGNQPWRLFPLLSCGIALDGWIAAGATATADNPGDRYNGPLSFNDRNEVQLNQLYVTIGRATDPCQCFSVGGRVDLLFGTDYIFTQAIGLETRRDGSRKWNGHDQYGLAMPQLYIEFAYSNLSVKVGHFYTIIGNESVAAPDNFFFSHSYTMQYGEPFTHTGVLANYAVSDRFNVLAGIHGGWDTFDPIRQRAGFLGGFTWSNCDESFDLAFMLTSGDELDPSSAFNRRTMYSIVASFSLSNNVNYIVQHDNGWQRDWFGLGRDAEWYGLNQYLIYTINDCWRAGLRFEWFRDDDGTRVAGVRNNNPATGPFDGSFYETSLGLNWTPSSNLTIRPELRWDWFNGNGLPYDQGTEDRQFTAAFDAVLIF